MNSRALLAVAACLMLSVSLGGCWRSTILLLDPAEGARPLTDGTYARADEPAAGEADNIVWKGDGFYELQDEGSISVFTLTPLGEIGGRQAFAAAMADDGCQSGEAEDCEWDYGVLFVGQDGIFVATPDCKDNSILARSWGAAPSPDSAYCDFARGADLKQALAAFAERADKLDRFVKR